MTTICLHGPESTGKSTLIEQLAARFGTIFVPEYGRTFAETHGTDFSMADLVEIAQTHDAMTQAALATGADPLFLDTDPLMTAVWADMLFGARDPWFDAWQRYGRPVPVARYRSAVDRRRHADVREARASANASSICRAPSSTDAACAMPWSAAKAPIASPPRWQRSRRWGWRR